MVTRGDVVMFTPPPPYPLIICHPRMPWLVCVCVCVGVAVGVCLYCMQ